MKLPVEWTNVYLEKKLTARKLADTLELAGVEVEEIVQPGKLDTQIVVGETVAIDSHPNADKLKIVKVNVKNTTISVVCGAPNVALKQKVAVALPGAVLPNGLEIKNSSIRGVKSEGMICSEQELGLGSDHSGILVLPDNTKIGSGLGGVIKGRELIDLTSYPNRWDLNSVVGLAREAAAHSGQKVAFEEPEQIKSSRAPVVVKTPERDLVPRYMLAHLRVSNTGSSPDWMVSRLKAAGIRPISVVVDITNYVMLELGQPLHAFDAAKIMQPVSVRRAKKGEVMVTLDGVERKLDTEDLLISDKQKPLGFAGVMGGQNSETSADTTDILLESASFNAASVRKTAIRHGLRTEASARFERGIPVDLAPLALARAVQLLKDLASAELIAGPADLMSAKPEATQIVARLQRISNILGIELTAKEAADNLKKLGFEAHRSTEEKLSITVPWWRPDIKTEADLAEEVIKLIGYDKLPATLPGWKPQAITFDKRWSAIWRAKDIMCSLGLFEVSTYSFISEKQIADIGAKPAGHLKLKNPLSSEQAYLRSDLLPSLLKTAERNRSYSREFGVFEFSRVYVSRGEGKLPAEPLRLGVLIRTEAGGYKSAKRALDCLAREFNLQISITPQAFGTMAHPANAAVIKAGTEVIGLLCQLHPVLTKRHKISAEIGYLEVDWDRLMSAVIPRVYREASRYPSIERDIAIVLKSDINWNKIEQGINASELASAEFLSDYYGSDLPKGHKSLAIRLHFQSMDRTLTDKEAEAGEKKVLALLKKRFGAAPRK